MYLATSPLFSVVFEQAFIISNFSNQKCGNNETLTMFENCSLLTMKHWKLFNDDYEALKIVQCWLWSIENCSMLTMKHWKLFSVDYEANAIDIRAVILQLTFHNLHNLLHFIVNTWRYTFSLSKGNFLPSKNIEMLFNDDVMVAVWSCFRVSLLPSLLLNKSFFRASAES